MQFVQPTAVRPGALVYPAAHLATLRPQFDEIRFDARHVVVRRTVRNTRRLEQLGYHAPSPMLETYGWPSRFPRVFDHQKTTSAFLATNHRAFCFNDMGTGKTASVLWAWDYLRQQGYAKRMLIVCPLNCVRSVWKPELFNVLPSVGAAFLTGDKKKRLEGLASKAKILVINHDGLDVIKDELAADGNGISHVVVDECTAFKNHRGTRFKALKMIADNRALWALTGTPASQGATDIWSLGSLICPKRVSPSFNQWRSIVCVPKELRLGPNNIVRKWEDRRDAMDIVFEKLWPAIRFEKADCLDMPEVVSFDREIPLSAEQRKFAEQLVRHWIVEDQTTGTIVTAANAAVRLTKLLQVFAGSVIATQGPTVHLDISDRLDALKDLIDGSKTKTIVFASYRAVLERLNTELGKTYEVAMIHGDVSEMARTDILRAFKPKDGPQVLLAHPKSAGHGLNLTSASSTVWWGPYTSTEVYKQANNRMDRPGQRFDMILAHLTGGSVETRMYDIVRKNLTNQKALLDLYHQATQSKG